MNKRLEKRHKRQVLRAREHVKVSEPDVRTPEQIRAAKEAGRTFGDHQHGPLPPYVAPANAVSALAAEEAAEEPAEKTEE